MIICGTGHRPDKLGGYDNFGASQLLLDLAKHALSKLQPSLVISGGAQGWDTVIAAAAASLGIPYDVYVPLPGQELIWPEAAQHTYDLMLVGAREVKVISTNVGTGKAFWNRNAAMVDNSDRVLAMWDGSPGGTRNCVLYADYRKRPVMNLWPDWQRLHGVDCAPSGWL